jgi:D-alanyl-D-alanine carboxypeptidase/D-alanyl-D-alanine-endopeptidase (penicillin-binding protein 4)
MNHRRFTSARFLVLGSALMLLTGACARPPYTGTDRQLAARIDEVLTRLAPTGATVTARVLDLADGAELYARDADQPRIPASNMKLPVTAAGLERFGANCKFKTYLAMYGDDLWIIGTGDPGPGDHRLSRAAGGNPTTVLDRWADALAARGVTSIPGDLVYYDGAFEPTQIHPTWAPHVLHWYAAPVSGLNFNDNCVVITIFPTQPGQAVRYEVMPPVRDIQVINQCTTGEKHEPVIEKRPGGNIYVLSGTCSKEAALKDKPVENPGAFFADALRTHLAGRGITVKGEIGRAAGAPDGRENPEGDNLIAVHETPIVDILGRINTNSQNLFAECLLKLTGRVHATSAFRTMTHGLPPGSWENGADAVHSFMRRSGIDPTGLVVADGSGLSRANRVSARQLSDLLRVMHGRRDGWIYVESLARAGDGSLGGRMSDLSGRVFAKTGYIGGVRALSGYVLTKENRWLAFSFLYNDIPGKVEPYEELQDEAVRLLSAWTAPAKKRSKEN